MSVARIAWTDGEGYAKDKQLALVLPLWQLLEHFPIDVRREFVSWALADGELLRTICYQISERLPDGSEYPAADYWLNERERTALRVALLPLLPNAVAEELRHAIEKSEKNEHGASTLRSLIHVKLLYESADCAELRMSRADQLEGAWRSAMKWYDEQGGSRP